MAVLVASCAGASARELEQFSSGATCKASAASSAIKSKTSVIATAFAEAVAVGCSAKLPADVLVVKIQEKVRVFAEAFVQVATIAYAKCKTSGNAFGCADANAFAKAQTKAFIALQATAAAAAFNNCKKCNANAAAAVTADLIVVLLARARSLSQAGVCVGPDQTASAVAFSTCTAEVLARGYTKAIAVALIQGDCTLLTADAKAKVKNVIDAFPECTCDGYACTDGNCNLDNSAVVASFEPYSTEFPTAYAATKARCLAAAAQVYPEM